jgi:hypothetical protein
MKTRGWKRKAELKKKIVETVKKIAVGIIVEHVCVGTEMGPGGSNEDQRGLVGVRVQQAGKWGGTPSLPPSQNMLAAPKRLV